jgi:hypothetical protein
MAADDSDFWATLDDAVETVESWPAWQQRYEADVYGGGDELPVPDDRVDR